MTASTEQERAELRGKAMQLYEAPFKFESGYIFDAKGRMVSDDNVEQESQVARVRGWGRISYLPNAEALQDEVGAIIADALTTYWQAARRAPVVQPGWKLVPVEPTSAMLRAGCDEKNASRYVFRRVPRVYAAMLAAAPQPPEEKHIGDCLDDQCKGCMPSMPPVTPEEFSRDMAEMMAAPVQLPEPAVPYAIFDCHGFYETRATKAAAQSFCDHYNKRDADGGGSAPYTVQPLYTEHQVRQLLAAPQPPTASHRRNRDDG